MNNEVTIISPIVIRDFIMELLQSVFASDYPFTGRAGEPVPGGPAHHAQADPSRVLS